MKDRADKTYVNQRSATLTFVHWAEKEGFIPENSFRYSHVETVIIGPGQRATCSPEDLAKLIAASGDLRDEVCISLGAHAGIRHEELTRFRLIFVDMKNRIISLPPFYSLAKVTKVPVARTIPIQPVLYARLERLIATGFDLNERVMRVSKWAQRLRVIKAHAKVKLPPNAFRHGYASHRRQLTQNPAQTAMEMGTSLHYLTNNYAVPQPEHISNAWFAV